MPELNHGLHGRKSGSSVQSVVKVSLELILQSKLHLPRRPGIACREASSRNQPKSAATNLRSPSGLTEVRVIEHVKDFPPEFNHLAFSQFRALNQRQV